MNKVSSATVLRIRSMHLRKHSVNLAVANSKTSSFFFENAPPWALLNRREQRTKTGSSARSSGLSAKIIRPLPVRPPVHPRRQSCSNPTRCESAPLGA